MPSSAVFAILPYTSSVNAEEREDIKSEVRKKGVEHEPVRTQLFCGTRSLTNVVLVPITTVQAAIGEPQNMPPVHRPPSVHCGECEWSPRGTG